MSGDPRSLDLVVHEIRRCLSKNDAATGSCRRAVVTSTRVTSYCGE